jgi:hypothetical protein
LQEADHTKIEDRTSFTRENYRLMRERLMRIVWWKEEYGGEPPLNRDVNEAAKNVVMMDLAILQAETSAGMYKKPIEVLAREVHYEPLPREVRAIVIAAWQRGRLLSQASIEQMVRNPRKPLDFSFFPASNPLKLLFYEDTRDNDLRARQRQWYRTRILFF